MENKAKMYTPDGRNAFKNSFIRENLDDLLGQILTVIDASISEERQNKSIKDLVKDKFHQKQNWFSDCSWKEKPQGVELSDRIICKPSDDWFTGIVEM